MDKEAILAKSRIDNKGRDEMEKQAQLKAASISRAVGFLLCSLAAMLEGIFMDSGVIGAVCWMVYWGMLAAEGWILTFTLKKKWGLVGTLINTAFFVAFAIIFFIKGILSAV